MIPTINSNKHLEKNLMNLSQTFLPETKEEFYNSVLWNYLKTKARQTHFRKREL